MRVSLLESRKLTATDDLGLINRRNVLVGSGLCAALTIGYPFLGKNEANAQLPQLITALLTGIELAKELWKILQPTQGQITIVNKYNIIREGDVIFQVLGPRGVEDFAYFSYRLPPQFSNTYEFNDGPHGIFSGLKDFNGRTARGQMATRMVVEP